jgi:hypothetical protein
MHIYVFRKRLEVSATQKAIEDERTKRMELNDTFALEVQNVSKRIEDVATNKQINRLLKDMDCFGYLLLGCSVISASFIICMLTLLTMPLAGLHICVGLDFVTPSL